MRKIIVEAEVSADGVMGSDNVDFWKQVFQFHTDDVRQYLNDLLFMPDALLMGKNTYESFAQIWPTRDGPDADRINGMPKFVASRTLTEPLTWNAALITGDVVEAITKLKQAPGQSLLQYGVGELTHTMLKAGLVDEIRLLVYPFTFGEGPRLFDHMGLHVLELLENQKFQSGTVALHYHPVVVRS
jgi:dihydrofolate reductase